MSNSREIIEQLSPGDALAVLKTLVRDDEAIAARIAEVAIAHLNKLTLEDVASVLYDELDALDVEEVWTRAGRTRYGYVEPIEVADEMVEVVIAPYLEELQKYQTLAVCRSEDSISSVEHKIGPFSSEP